MPSTEQLKIYRPSSLEKPEIPQRSTLYFLDPIGIGTPFSESLTSYISRLAEAHCVPLGELCLTTISPLLGRELSSSSRARSIDCVFGSSTIPRTLNGRGKSACNMVEAIKKLTLCNQLHLLTLLNWSNLLSDKGLLRPVKAWCPFCFQTWREKNELIYEPLMWFLREVMFCPHHKIPLQTSCPYCHQYSKILAWKNSLGYCSKCKEWLGTESGMGISDSQCKNEAKLNLWISESIGEIISHMPLLSSPEPRKNVTNSMGILINSLGGISSFTKIFEQDFSRVSDWQKGKNIPKFSTILRLCYQLDVSLLSFLSGCPNNSSFDELILQKTSCEGTKKIKSKLIAGKRILREEIHQALLEALEEDPPVRSIEVLQRLGLKSRTVINKYFPELGKKISKRYSDYNTQKRREELRCKVESIINIDEYPPPSLQDVCRRIGANDSTLYLHFSDLCKVITTRYKYYLILRKNERISNIEQEVRQAAIELHEKGVRPTSVKVGELLQKPGLLREGVAANALFEIQRKLGYRK